jgi:hypothetical protein
MLQPLMPQSPDLPSERKQLIASELRAHGIGETDPFRMFDSLVDVVYAVMTAPPHESRVPGTGVAIFSHPIEQYGVVNDPLAEPQPDRPKFIRASRRDENACWSLADGIHSFVAQDSECTGLLLLEKPIIDELDLFTLRSDRLFNRKVGPSDPPQRECLVVQRGAGHMARRLTVLCREKIVTFSGLSYFARPYQYDILRALRRDVVPFPWGDDEIQAVKSTLRVAVHQLSPGGIGTTLVLLAPTDVPKLEELVRSRDLVVARAHAPAVCSITDRSMQRPLVHVMSQTDGATVILPDGSVRYFGAFFRSVSVEDETDESTRRYGARHRSASDFSRLIEGVVVVVSSDGPVSIYHQGRQLPIPTPTLSEPIE